LAGVAAASLLPVRSARADGSLRLVAFGDSLTAGLGLPQGAAFPLVLQGALLAKGHVVAITNAGVSGNTAEDGLARLDWSVPQDTQGVILELGANNMLRGLDPARTEETLREIIEALLGRKIAVLLCGMYAAPNLGAEYVVSFNAIYPRLAEEYKLALYPFFLDGVTGNPSLTLPDGLHPNADGVKVIVSRILQTVEAFIEQIGRGALRWH
jgi:acyl-CoA thioesterase I